MENFVGVQGGWRRLFIWLFAFQCLTSAIAAPASAPPASSVGDVLERVALKYGVPTPAPGERGLTLTLVDVIDSRCPTGVECVWAGELSILIRVQRAGSTASQLLTIHHEGHTGLDLSAGGVVANTGRHQLKVVAPRPSAGVVFQPDFYEVDLLRLAR